MARIKIPFNEWSRERLQGHKTATSRTKIYGRPGDTFVVDDREYELWFVAKVSLQEVASHYYWEEGADSPEEFIEVWKSIHPRVGYRPHQIVYLHQFEQVKGR